MRPLLGLTKFLALALAALVAGVAPAAADAYTRDAELEHVASTFAMRAAEVRCPSSFEWDNFAIGELGVSDPDLVYGVTHLKADWMMLRTDLCDAAAHAEDNTIDPETRALGVLTIVHEAYHVRRWWGRRNEGRVQCQAMRHFRVGVQLLGGTRADADLLYSHALEWHAQIAQPGTEYYWPFCALPAQ